jgi:hypothetical protein
MIRDDEWVEVPNDMVYIGTVVMSPQGTPLLDLGYTWVMPNPDKNLLPVNKEGDLLRVVVQGEILKNDAPTGNFVGAYVDINLVSR